MATRAIADFEPDLSPTCTHCARRLIVARITPADEQLEWSYRCPGCGSEQTVMVETEA